MGYILFSLGGILIILIVYNIVMPLQCDMCLLEEEELIDEAKC